MAVNLKVVKVKVGSSHKVKKKLVIVQEKEAK